MAEFESSQSRQVSGVDEVRQQLLRRIGIAGVIIVTLVAALAVFDAVFVSELPPPTEVVVAPMGTGIPATPAVTDPLPPKPTAGLPGTIVEAPEDIPVTPPAPVSAPERTASPEAPPLRTVPRPLTKPATAQPASIKPATSVAAVPESSKAAAPANARPPAARPLTQVAEKQRRYVVQMGVFSNVVNAEELHAKLQKAGIPSQIEARVHVGPFDNRAEAEAAQKKMSELGLDGGMLISSRK